MLVRGVRGATVVTENSKEAILHATVELLHEIIKSNPGLSKETIASVFFTTTSDLNATFPAYAARQLGWSEVPLLCAQEISVPDSLACCLRVLIHWNTVTDQKDIKHVYLKEARNLRPDLTHNDQTVDNKGA